MGPCQNRLLSEFLFFVFSPFRDDYLNDTYNYFMVRTIIFKTSKMMFLVQLLLNPKHQVQLS